MKKYIIVILSIFQVFITTAQVGIGTDNPLADLHVAGDLLVQNEFNLSTIGTVSPADEDFQVISKNKEFYSS